MHTVISTPQEKLFLVYIPPSGSPMQIGAGLPADEASFNLLSMKACHLNGGLPFHTQLFLDGVAQTMMIEQKFVLSLLAKGIMKMMEEHDDVPR